MCCCLMVLSVNAHATGLGFPDLGSVGNILIYGGVIFIFYVIPLVLIVFGAITVLILVIKLFRQRKSRNDIDVESDDNASPENSDLKG